MANQYLATKRKVLHDLVRALDGYDYSVESHAIKNTDDDAIVIDDPVGFPMKNNAGVWELLVAGDEASCAGLLLEQFPIPSIAAGATTAKKYAILVRDAIVSPSAIAIKDAIDGAGGTFNQTTLKTSLQALNVPILVKDVPSQTTTQTS